MNSDKILKYLTKEEYLFDLCNKPVCDFYKQVSNGNFSVLHLDLNGKGNKEPNNGQLHLNNLYESHRKDFLFWLIHHMHDLAYSSNLNGDDIRCKIKRILLKCDLNKNSRLWEELKINASDNHHDQLQTLLKKFPALTVNDMRILAYIKLNLTTKEIASITFRPVNTVKATRKRIRKKLGITDTKRSLSAFLAQH